MSLHCSPTVRRRIVDSTATFDVAWLTRNHFAGYECKTSIVPFILSVPSISRRARRKLCFMLDTIHTLGRYKRHGEVFLVGLERNVRDVREALIREGYGSINVLGANE